VRPLTLTLTVRKKARPGRHPPTINPITFSAASAAARNAAAKRRSSRHRIPLKLKAEEGVIAEKPARTAVPLHGKGK